jgi:hypothetical protein
MLQEFTQEVKNTITEMLQGIHTVIPGKIVKYYSDKCEAEILPYGKFKKPNGEFMDFPQLNHIPILFQQSCGQDFSVVYPVKPGDECLIMVNEQTLDIWRGSGVESDNDLRFDLTNAVAIVGMFSRPQPLAQEAQNDDKLIFQKNGHRLHINPSEILVKFSSEVNILLNELGITITAPVINLLGAAQINLTSGADINIVSGSEIMNQAPRIDLN